MIELLSNSEMAQADRLTITGGMPGIQLMERAGRAVADAVLAQARAGGRIVVVAGPGNNGGDGFVAARLLSERGYSVDVMLVGEAGRLNGDAALAAKRWSGPLAAGDPAGLAGAQTVIDALFGAGLDPDCRRAASRHDRGYERTTGAGRRGRPAKRHQWYVRSPNGGGR